MMSLKVLREGLHTSVSQVKCYLRCPRQFELKYVRGVAPAFRPLALVFGSAMHEVLAAYYRRIQTGGSAQDHEELIDSFSDAWHAAVAGAIPLQVVADGDRIDPIDLGARMLGAFYDHAASALPQVEAVEVPFEVELHDPTTGEPIEEKLVGAFDLVVVEGEHKVIVEHKTAARRYGLDQLRYDQQLTAYQVAAKQLGAGNVGLRFQILTKTKSPSVQVEDVRRDNRDEDDFLRTVVGVLRAIDAGAFFPVRGWQCDGCQVAHACSSRE